MGSPVAGVHRGLTPQMYGMPVVLKKSHPKFGVGYLAGNQINLSVSINRLSLSETGK
ncbi:MULTISPECIES: hypothetical protein [Streptococcus]|uniref:hypothetical protein n=1 Tax=Streptococcus TaxID=1301 RepID=UPI0014288F70|nr:MULTISPECIES: hypothetical protein [Streptococcus]